VAKIGCGSRVVTLIKLNHAEEQPSLDSLLARWAANRTYRLAQEQRGAIELHGPQLSPRGGQALSRGALTGDRAGRDGNGETQEGRAQETTHKRTCSAGVPVHHTEETPC
jgi:hypothetical protein